MDITQIEGYREDMTPDEKLSLIEGYTPEEAPKKPVVDKVQFDKVSSELAEAKRQLKAKRTDDENLAAERQALFDQQAEELKSLRREKTLAGHTTSFMDLGLEKDLAGKAASMLADGDTDGLFEALKKHQQGFEKSLRAKILAETPKPPTHESKPDNNSELRKYFGLPT